eukprot:m.186518 g.186518  ORF g.186518 m.186518 type:complete len:347 (-) comp14755_c0_seq1:387-1427(-)
MEQTFSLCGAAVPIKYASLIILIIQNSALYLMLRASRTQEGPLYIAGTAVILSESCKLFASLTILMFQHGPSEAISVLKRDIFGRPVTTLKLMVPAGLYTFQNTLQYLAVTYLDAATFQVTYQLKILTTALFAVILLGKSLSSFQWLSLVMLMSGVALIQMPEQEEAAAEEEPLDGAGSMAGRLLGLIMVIAACFSSGFAGVYFEKVLKGETAGLWVLNVQLASLSIIIGTIGLLYNEYEIVTTYGFFYGYNKQAFIAIGLQAFGGLVVAVVVKYADNILKGFATSISIVLSSVLSAIFLDFSVTTNFGIGATCVILASYLYGAFASKTASPSLPTSTTSPSKPQQ